MIGQPCEGSTKDVLSLYREIVVWLYAQKELQNFNPHLKHLLLILSLETMGLEVNGNDVGQLS